MAMVLFKRYALAALIATTASVPVWAREGVDVGERSVFVGAVSAESVEQQSLVQYRQTLKAAADQQALGPSDNAQVRRLRAIAKKNHSIYRRVEPARKTVAMGSEPDRLQPDQRLLHAGRQDCVLHRHSENLATQR